MNALFEASGPGELEQYRACMAALKAADVPQDLIREIQLNIARIKKAELVSLLERRHRLPRAMHAGGCAIPIAPSVGCSLSGSRYESERQAFQSSACLKLASSVIGVSHLAGAAGSAWAGCGWRRAAILTPTHIPK
jgi:hypothetical protein